MTMGVHDAAVAAGVGKSYPFAVRRRDPEFAAAWETARRAKYYVQLVCEQCGSSFKHSLGSSKPGRFCSERCHIACQRAVGIAQAEELFWAKVEKDGPTPLHVPELGPCWTWTAGVDQNGYGMYRHKRSHRFAWELAHGEIPDGMQALHRCDNPPCVRMDHLFLGTLLVNMADRNAKERQARGERSGRAVLTEAQVVEARQRRAAGELVKDIAAEYAVSASTLSHAVVGQSWRHVA